MSVMTPIFAGLWEHYIFWSLVVGAIAFGWLFHHSFWFTSKDGESLPNVDEIKLGVFPKHNDDMRLEVAWTVLHHPDCLADLLFVGAIGRNVDIGRWRDAW